MWKLLVGDDNVPRLQLNLLLATCEYGPKAIPLRVLVRGLVSVCDVRGTHQSAGSLTSAPYRLVYGSVHPRPHGQVTHVVVRLGTQGHADKQVEW